MKSSSAIAAFRAGQVRNYQIRLKAPGAGHEPALFVEDTASAIEDQVVVAAYLIDVEERNPVLFRQVSQHGLAVFLLAGGEGRGGEVDDSLGSRRHQLLHGIGVVATAFPKVAIVPDILADGDAEDSISQLQDLRLCRRLKVAVLVKYIVSGKQRLFKGPLHPAITKKGGRVEERTAHLTRIGLGQAHQKRREIGKLFGQVAQDGPTALYKIGIEEQVAGRVAEQCQLGGDG